MLKSIRIVTLTVSNLKVAERAYCDWLGYQPMAGGRISARLAKAWNTPAAEKSAYSIVHTASGSDVLLRLIERPATRGFKALRTHGWNANELLVTDPAALEKRLRDADSPFSVIGATAALDSNPRIVAMQALGPDDALHYFTKIPPEGGTFIKQAAATFVDRTFIAVVGGPSMTALRAFYGERLGMSVTEPFASKVPVLNAALGLPAEQQIPLALVPLSPKFVLELDEYPALTVPRPLREGDLPPGMAMVSFEVDALDESLPWRSPPVAKNETPYFGKRAGVIVGPAGEWIELIEA